MDLPDITLQKERKKERKKEREKKQNKNLYILNDRHKEKKKQRGEDQNRNKMGQRIRQRGQGVNVYFTDQRD